MPAIAFMESPPIKFLSIFIALYIIIHINLVIILYFHYFICIITVLTTVPEGDEEQNGQLGIQDEENGAMLPAPLCDCDIKKEPIHDRLSGSSMSLQHKAHLMLIRQCVQLDPLNIETSAQSLLMNSMLQCRFFRNDMISHQGEQALIHRNHPLLGA